MKEEIFILASLPVILIMMSIFVKFILLCQTARDEEQAVRVKAVKEFKRSSNLS